MLIEPDGRVNLVACGDQIHAETALSCWGLSSPQSSVKASTLNSTCHSVAEACKERGIVGYLTIDFVTFIDPKTVRYRASIIILYVYKYETVFQT